MKKTYVGIDLHKDNFIACFLKKNEEVKFEKFELNELGFKKFIKLLNKTDEIAVESTSNSGYFYRHVKKYVKKITLIAPGQFFIISKSIKKTDKNDAEALAWFLSKGMVPKARIKDKKYLDLYSLIHTRKKLTASKIKLTNRVHSISSRYGIIIPKRRLSAKNAFAKYVYVHEWETVPLSEIEIIENQIIALNSNIKNIENLIEKEASKLEGYENLMSIYGISSLSAATFLSVIANINDFPSASHLASYFGIVPRVSMSNETDKPRRITKRGSKVARSTLVLCMSVAKQKNSYLKEFYERIKGRRGSGRAMIATSRKFLNIIYNTLKNDWIFDDFANYKYHVRDSQK